MPTVRDRLIRVAMALALLVAGGALYLAFARGETEDDNIVTRGAILAVFPQPGSNALRQEQIGVDLAFGHTATITIDRRYIPEDQLDVVPGINRVSFTPGPGKEIESLDEGRHCATVSVTRGDAARASSAGTSTTAPGSTAPQSYTWCFNAA